MRDSRAQASDMRGTENGLLYGPSQIVSPGGNSTFGILRLGDALMDASYNLNGGFNPALKRFADLDGPDFFPTPDWATYALIDNESLGRRLRNFACLVKYGERWRGTARRAILDMGLKPPAEVDRR